MPSAVRSALTIAALLAALSPAAAWELSGVKQLMVQTSDGQTLTIGTVTFRPAADKTAFAVDLDLAHFKDFFLSMREFKCLEGKEVQCHVPYPYKNPLVVTDRDLRWLETSLIFMHKSPAQFGATLANGLYYEMTLGPDGIEGTPRAVDLNQIAAPPDDLDAPPFPPDDRLEIEPGARWVTKLTIR